MSFEKEILLPLSVALPLPLAFKMIILVLVDHWYLLLQPFLLCERIFRDLGPEIPGSI